MTPKCFGGWLSHGARELQQAVWEFINKKWPINDAHDKSAEFDANFDPLLYEDATRTYDTRKIVKFLDSTNGTDVVSKFDVDTLCGLVRLDPLYADECSELWMKIRRRGDSKTNKLGALLERTLETFRHSEHIVLNYKWFMSLRWIHADFSHVALDNLHKMCAYRVSSPDVLTHQETAVTTQYILAGCMSKCNAVTNQTIPYLYAIFEEDRAIHAIERRASIAADQRTSDWARGLPQPQYDQDGKPMPHIPLEVIEEYKHRWEETKKVLDAEIVARDNAKVMEKREVANSILAKVLGPRYAWMYDKIDPQLVIAWWSGQSTGSVHDLPDIIKTEKDQAQVNAWFGRENQG